MENPCFFYKKKDHVKKDCPKYLVGRLWCYYSHKYIHARYDGSSEQRPGPFAKYLEECGIIPQYTMPRKPSMNGIVERGNRTLKDMVRSIISHSSLLESLWGEALKIAAYILNRGCPAEARPYRPNERKLDPRTISCYFVGYFEHSRGFKFYDPSSKSFFETENAKFLEDVEFEGEYNIKKVISKKELVSLPNVGIDDVQTPIPEFTMEQIIEQYNNEVPEVQTQ
ncbi:Retrovirus-related Pol polyprotein from transposon TNT 1-94 [Cucumis melo var. makuwa]|uniref:Retrovirus-related Pol polyprotein from transposon TNT 1-94 n=1 Tax=Cucumis melo var. makuwa TaxID=1194695 RepID=A0A5A7TZS7_CUCMM|nr:Retrovirus-related Pol polyprotein from transposon TNT 1-94 [Cucumis melo var. makuwa]TYK28337.1 Retrovirus-related Pol polyprotein from transposon TNT 1-94 [Cucumis melo var. makuwa]